MDRANSSRAAGGTDSAVSGNAASGTEETDATGEQAVNTTLEKDDLFHVLQNQRRRRVLAHLRGATGPVDMRDIAERIAARENGKPVRSITSNERQRAYIALYQSHLPKLDEMGVVQYQQDRGIVERTELADQFDPYLDVDAEPEVTTRAAESDVSPDRTVRYYGAATVLGAALTLASSTGTVRALSPESLAVSVVGLFVLVTGLVAYERRS